MQLILRNILRAEYILCCFIFLPYLILKYILWNKYYYHFYFTDEETIVEGTWHILSYTVINWWNGDYSQGMLIPKPTILSIMLLSLIFSCAYVLVPYPQGRECINAFIGHLLCTRYVMCVFSRLVFPLVSPWEFCKPPSTSLTTSISCEIISAVFDKGSRQWACQDWLDSTNSQTQVFFLLHSLVHLMAIASSFSCKVTPPINSLLSRLVGDLHTLKNNQHIQSLGWCASECVSHWGTRVEWKGCIPRGKLMSQRP